MIEIDKGICRPEFPAQLLSSDHLPRPFKEGGQHLKRLFLELYLLSPPAQFPSV